MDDAWDEGYAAGLVDAETVADQERDDLARKLKYAQADNTALRAEVEQWRQAAQRLIAAEQAFNDLAALRIAAPITNITRVTREVDAAVKQLAALVGETQAARRGG